MFSVNLKSKFFISLAVVAFCLAGCNTPATTPTLTPTFPPSPTAPSTQAAQPVTSTALPAGATPVVISEILAGLQGNNTYEFIELYNRSGQPVDIRGWALWYRLPSSREDLFIYRWQRSTVIAPYGHYLLTYAGVDVGLPADVTYDEQALNLSSGGLQLRQMDGEIMDAVGWGDAPADFYESSPTSKLTNGVSIERLPGGDAGNATDSDNNAADFALRQATGPQNSASPVTPLPAERIELQIDAPEAAEPGSSFTYTVVVTNTTGQALHNLTVTLPIPDQLSPATQPVVWEIADLPVSASATTQIPVNVPYTYFDAELRNAFVQAEDWPSLAFAAPVLTRIEGGHVPISAARALAGSELTIEGVAVMYTGGYYAGGGNVKFYLADESGSIQVQVFEGQGVVRVGIGDRVRVRGEVSVYRDSLQIVPKDAATDVIVTSPADVSAPELLPAPVSIQASVTDVEELSGRLVQVEGLVARVEEFTYSYEIDLGDEADGLLTLYVDKQTGIDVEKVETGQHYRAAGILDRRDGENLLYPRIQSDLEEVFPPVLRLTADGPMTRAENLITYTLTAYNHTPEVFNNVVITASQPNYTAILDVNGGERQGNLAVWKLARLAANEQVSVTLRVKVASSYAGPVVLDEVIATADEWQAAPAVAAAVRTFSGNTVPVWAIQGDSFRSPLAFARVTTQGVVTGVFPGLQGFFIQGEPDYDPLTSDGVFVFSADLVLDVIAGDSVQVAGKVRELSGQTALQMTAVEDLQVLERGLSLPEPVELDPPAAVAAAGTYYESLEGMFCQVSGPALAVSPTSKFGETVLVRSEHAVTRLYQGNDEQNGVAIMIDDGSSTTYTDRSQMPYAITAGDTVSALIGPLAYTYERYKLEPVVIPAVQPSSLQPSTIPSSTSAQFTLMTWNVENLFDTRTPHPDDPPLPTNEQYNISLAKVANTIQAAGAPLIVALQEVENIAVMQDIADQEVLAEYAYEPVLIEGTDSRGIDVGFLIRSDRAEIVDIQQRDAPEGLTSRPPLIVKVSVQTDGDPVTLYVINNHFTSMSGGEQATEPRRIAQAEWNLTLRDEILADDPNALVAIVGDLNSYLPAAPIETLRAGGLQHVFDACALAEDTCPQGAPYTYIYQGEAQVIDHILLSPDLFALLQRVFILHVNADYSLPYPDDPSPTHKSDHDPVVAVFGSE